MAADAATTSPSSTSGTGRRADAMRRLGTELVMCSTCSGIVFRFKHTAVPNPQEEVVEVVRESEKMRDLMKAVLLHGPLQEMEPAGATKKQWEVLRRRRRVMMETRRCPACSGPLIEACPPTSSSSEKVIEFITSQGRKETKKTATEDKAMVADARLWEEGKRSSSGLNQKKKKKKKAKCEDKEGSRSKNKEAKRSNEMEGIGSWDVKMEDSGSREAKLKDGGLEEEVKTTRMLKPSKPQSKDIELAIRNWKTKMVTKRMHKKSIDYFMSVYNPQNLNLDFVNKNIADKITANYEVECVFYEYLQCHFFIKGYAEYQPMMKAMTTSWCSTIVTLLVW